VTDWDKYFITLDNSSSIWLFLAELHAKKSEEIFRIAFGPTHPLVSRCQQLQLEILYKKQVIW